MKKLFLKLLIPVLAVIAMSGCEHAMIEYVGNGAKVIFFNHTSQSVKVALFSESPYIEEMLELKPSEICETFSYNISGPKPLNLEEYPYMIRRVESVVLEYGIPDSVHVSYSDGREIRFTVRDSSDMGGNPCFLEAYERTMNEDKTMLNYVYTIED